jgi:DNA-directed RNA polymerase subunit RPC12/RpoP
MIDFCIECGHNLGNAPAPDGTIKCQHCGKTFRSAPAPQQKQIIDQNEVLIKQGKAARCPLCQQVVEVRGSGAKSYVPHFLKTERKMCKNSGKPVTG